MLEKLAYMDVDYKPLVRLVIWTGAASGVNGMLGGVQPRPPFTGQFACQVERTYCGKHRQHLCRSYWAGLVAVTTVSHVCDVMCAVTGYRLGF